jgi:hypothetical protein
MKQGIHYVLLPRDALNAGGRLADAAGFFTTFTTTPQPQSVEPSLTLTCHDANCSVQGHWCQLYKTHIINHNKATFN